MKELIVEILMNDMIFCSSEEYHSFVREELLRQKSFHFKAGDTVQANFLKIEIDRLDVLHKNLAVAV